MEGQPLQAHHWGAGGQGGTGHDKEQESKKRSGLRAVARPCTASAGFDLSPSSLRLLSNLS